MSRPREDTKQWVRHMVADLNTLSSLLQTSREQFTKIGSNIWQKKYEDNGNLFYEEYVELGFMLTQAEEKMRTIATDLSLCPLPGLKDILDQIMR